MLKLQIHNSYDTIQVKLFILKLILNYFVIMLAHENWCAGL